MDITSFEKTRRKYDMDVSTINILTEMGVSLAKLALKGTVTSVHNKIEIVKNEKNMETLRNTYNEIVNQLLMEREEAIRIAQAYKEELEKVEISDEDIRHLHNTVSTILEIVKSMSPNSNTQQLESFEQLKELINVDTLKALQLLGFNYKAAIGEPLTQVCAGALSSLGRKKR